MKRASEIQGWMTDAELAWLAEQGASAKRIVEVGSWKGRSTRALGAGGACIIAIDTWTGVPGDDETNSRFYSDGEQAYAEFLSNVAGLNVTPARTTSKYGPGYLSGQFDLIFIDADHRYEAVRNDILAYRPFVRPGGLLCGHDYHNDCRGVVQAVDELFPDVTIGPDTIWSVRV